MSSNLGLAVPGVSRLAGTPHRPDGFNVMHGQPLHSSDDNGVVDRLDIQDVTRLAVGSWNAQSQATPLTDGEVVITVVMTDESTGLVADLALSQADLLLSLIHI